jgi:hypothetical protein
MPTVDVNDLARLRELKQWSTPYLAVHNPNTMWTGTATGDPYDEFNAQVETSPDDGWWVNNPPVDTFSSTQGYARIGQTGFGGGPSNAWYRFSSVQIPRYASITSATIRLHAHGNISGVAPLTKLYGNDVGNATAPSDWDEAQALTLTTASVDWDPVVWVQGTWYTSPDISDVIQEIVNRGDWSMGNALMIVHKDDGSGLSNYIPVTSFDTSPSNCPMLDVEFESDIPTSQVIAYDNGGPAVGYTSDIFFPQNTTLWVGSTPGHRDVGIVRAKSMLSTWPHVTGAIKVAENSDIQWEDGLYLTLKDEHRVWPRFPRVALSEFPDPTGTIVAWWKDYDIEYADQSIEEPPVVVMGPPACAFIDGGLASVNFWGGDSYSPRDTELATGTWTFPHGTPATASTLGTEAAPHSVTWTTPGAYMTRLHVIDENGHTSNGYRPVFIFDRSGANAPYTDFEIRSMSGDFSAGGWTASFRVFAEADVEDFPEGTQIVVFAEDWYGGEKRSIGGYGDRENIVFVGWIKADSVRKEPTTGEITFDTHGVHGELLNCPGFPISVERVTETPEDWGEIYNMDLDLAAFHVGYWHSTMYEVSDVLESGDTRDCKYMDIPEGNIYNQLDRTVWNETILARTLVDRQGRIKYDHNPQYLQPHERGYLDTIMTLQNGDWLGRVEAQELHEPRVSWVDASGARLASWEKTYPVFSMAPGETPKADGAFTQLTNLLVSNQDDVNRMAGYALANANKAHPDRTTGLAAVRVPLQGNYRVFDIQPQEWVLFPSLDTLREARGPYVDDGTPWPTGTRFIPRDIDLSFDNNFGCFMTSLGLEPETIGPTGSSVVYPGQSGSGAAVAILVETMDDDDLTGDQIDMVFVTREVFADEPTWVRRHNNLPEHPRGGFHSFKVNNLEIDPLSNGYNGTKVQALIGTRARWNEYALIYHNADLYSDTPWVNVLDRADVLTKAYSDVGSIDDIDTIDIDYDRTTSGFAYAIIVAEHSVQGQQLLGFKTEDHGLSWSYVANISTQVDGAPPHDHSGGAQCLVIMDPYEPNYMYAKLQIGNTDNDWCWLRSTDKGVTWTIRMGGATTNTVYLNPQQNSDDAWYDPNGSGWSLGFFNQVGRDIAGNCSSFTVRYPSAGIAQGVTINSAHVQIKAYTSGQLGGAMNVKITGIDEDWLPTFTTRGAFDSWGTTAASVTWGIPDFVAGTTYTSPDLSTIIQELVNRTNWDPTCAIGLRFELTPVPPAWLGRMRVAYCYEDSPANTPRLDINYNCAALTTYPSIPAVLFPRHSRQHVASYWGLTPPTSYKTADGWASRYIWYEIGAGDGPVSMVEPLYGSYPTIYLTDVHGTDPDYTSYVHTTLDGESFASAKLLPIQIAQSFKVWPWAIEGADTLMYIGSRTGDGEAPMDHYPFQFWISEDTGESWQEKTGNLNDLMDSLGIAKDRTERIRPLEIDILF